MSVQIAQRATFKRMNGSTSLGNLVGRSYQGLIDASPKWPDLTKPQDVKLPRIVYRVPLVVPLGGLFKASGVLHVFDLDGDNIALIEAELRTLFNGDGYGVAWTEGSYRIWSVITGGGEEVQTGDADPIHQFFEIELDGSA